MVISVKKQQLVDEILKGPLFFVYQKQSAKNAIEIAMRFARKTENTSISSAETSLLQREAEGYIKQLQIYWNKCGQLSRRLKEKYPDIFFGNKVPYGINHHSEGEGSSADMENYQRKSPPPKVAALSQAGSESQ